MDIMDILDIKDIGEAREFREIRSIKDVFKNIKINLHSINCFTIVNLVIQGYLLLLSLKYIEIDAKSAFTCLQCKIEYFPENFVEGEKVLFYGLCRWHLGVWKCRNCSINLVGLGKIRAHK